MSEEWRRKAYYRTRVLIPVDECLDSAFGDCLVCLTGGQLNLVRNLLLYAERRSTFVSEYEPQWYLAPTEEEWDELQTMVAALEGNLMDCEQFTSDLQEILDWVRVDGSLTEPPFSEDEEAAFPYDGDITDDELTPEGEEACAVAQLWFEWGYQIITEQVLPATRWGFDYLVPAVAGFIALAIGGPPAAMGVYAVAEFIQELLEIAYRGAETNLVNWMDTNKYDIVCALYAGLVSGGLASAIWAAAYASEIDPAEDISVGDKLMLNLFMGTWAGGNAQRAYDAATDWSTDNVQAGYCLLCGEPDPDFEYTFNFPPCPGGWIPSGNYTYCVDNIYMGMHNDAGYWTSPTPYYLATGSWYYELYLEFYTEDDAGTYCGKLWLQTYRSGSWQDMVPPKEMLIFRPEDDEWYSQSSGVVPVDFVVTEAARMKISGYGSGQPGPQLAVRKVRLRLWEA